MGSPFGDWGDRPLAVGGLCSRARFILGCVCQMAVTTAAGVKQVPYTLHRLVLCVVDTSHPGGEGVRCQRKVCVRQIGLQLRAPYIDFTFFRRKTCLTWVGGPVDGLWLAPNEPSPPSPGNARCVYLIKDVARLGEPQHFPDAVLYADRAPKSMNAVGACSDSAFRFLTPICIIFHSRSF